jgi:hypothetical protein
MRVAKHSVDLITSTKGMVVSPSNYNIKTVNINGWVFIYREAGLWRAFSGPCAVLSHVFQRRVNHRHMMELKNENVNT